MDTTKLDADIAAAEAAVNVRRDEAEKLMDVFLEVTAQTLHGWIPQAAKKVAERYADRTAELNGTPELSALKAAVQTAAAEVRPALDRKLKSGTSTWPHRDGFTAGPHHSGDPSYMYLIGDSKPAAYLAPKGLVDPIRSLVTELVTQPFRAAKYPLASMYVSNRELDIEFDFSEAMFKALRHYADANRLVHEALETLRKARKAKAVAIATDGWDKA